MATLSDMRFQVAAWIMGKPRHRRASSKRLRAFVAVINKANPEPPAKLVEMYRKHSQHRPTSVNKH